MKELVAFLAKSLVDKPELVEVQEIEREDVVVVELRVAKDDLGKVIGKQGRTAKAIRTVLAATVTQHQKKARLEILE